jgi:endonuclease/exonuclease/phosphatase family metal-dependent hydrolase
MPRSAIEAVIDAPFGPLRVTTSHLEYYSGVQRSAQVERLRELHAEAWARAKAAPSMRYQTGPFAPLGGATAAIVTGDFNLPPEDPLYARMQAPFADGVPRLLDAWQRLHPETPHPPTFCLHDRGHGAAPYCCDFVFVSADLAPRLSQVRIDLDTQASDHQPVIVEFS